MERNDRELVSKSVGIESKTFFFDIKENQKGKYLRITEQSGGRSSIVVPLDGVNLFQDKLAEIIEESAPLVKTEV